MDAPGVLALFIPILGLMLGAFIVFSKSDIGRAFADRLRGGVPDSAHLTEQLEALPADLEALRGQLAETQERLDFTERVLAAGKER